MMYLANAKIKTLYSDDGTRKAEVFKTTKNNIGYRKWRGSAHGKGWVFSSDVLYDSNEKTVRQVTDMAEDWVLREFG